MKRLVCFIILLILTVMNVIAQKWVSTDYKNEWGDPSGKRSISQRVEGISAGIEMKIIVEISRDIPSINDFNISTYNLNGTRYEYLAWTTKIISGPSKREYKKHPFMDPTVVGKVKREEGKYLFKYKIGDKESSFRISTPNTINIFSSRGNTISVNYSELNAILLSTSLPIKCIIAEEMDEIRMANLIRFTLYPANYKQLVN